MHFGLVAEMLALLALANGTPVVAKDILGDRLAQPVDGGATLPDGRPLFGSSKTFRGIVLSILITSAAAKLFAHRWTIGALIAGTAMAGDLLSSFLKRRMSLPAGSKATGLDQIPESLFPLLACRAILPLTALDILVVVAIFFMGEMYLSRILYRFHLRDRPY